MRFLFLFFYLKERKKKEKNHQAFVKTVSGTVVQVFRKFFVLSVKQ
jgi:hypothetical protein